MMAALMAVVLVLSLTITLSGIGIMRLTLRSMMALRIILRLLLVRVLAGLMLRMMILIFEMLPMGGIVVRIVFARLRLTGYRFVIAFGRTK